MSRSKAASSIDSIAAALRKSALEAETGTLLGSEEALITKLGTSRATIRQAARLLEREGLLRVRRGIHGGYFAARPGFNTIEYAISAYLESLAVSADELTTVRSILWVEFVGKAAGMRTEDAKALAEHFCGKVGALRLDASLDDVKEINENIRRAILELIKSRYIDLIFNVNTAFGRRKQLANPADRHDTSEHREFVRAWRQAKLMELEAIADGEPELAMMAARHLRNIWHRRVWGHDCK